FVISLQNIEVAGKIQLMMLIFAVAGCLVASVAFMLSGVWSLDNFADFFYSQAKPSLGIHPWIIGLGFLITPFFGFETVPQMVEEGDFPTSNTKKAICGSVITCGTIYMFFFFCVAGLDSFDTLLAGDAQNGFMTITAMQTLLGWKVWPLIYGCISILMGMTASILGFWMSIVRMMYSMGKKNFLPEVFTKVNKHQQPILPNIFLLGISLIFILIQNATTFMNDFFNLMSFGCACAYALTMISAIRIHAKHGEWYKDNKNLVKGGNFTRALAMIIMVAIAFFCTLGQGKGSWISFGVYMGVGAVIWLWMVLVRWKKSKVIIETPDGEKEF
ncbi:MAG: APC family permease, partial [Ruthenibacterium sp.]